MISGEIVQLLSSYEANKQIHNTTARDAKSWLILLKNRGTGMSFQRRKEKTTLPAPLSLGPDRPVCALPNGPYRWSRPVDSVPQFLMQRNSLAEADEATMPPMPFQPKSPMPWPKSTAMPVPNTMAAVENVTLIGLTCFGGHCY